MKAQIGPAMLEVLEYVKENPGSPQKQVQQSLTAKGNHWQVINRALKAGLIRREPILTEDGYPKGWLLYANED